MKLRLSPISAVALAAFCLLPLTVLPVVAQTEPNMVGVSDSVPWNQTGQTFVQNMLMSDKFEIESSRLALDKSRDPAIRDFARDMIAAHSETSTDLKATADRNLVGRLVTPPPKLDPGHMNMYHALEASFGRDFDREYVHQQFIAHREALAFMEGYARHGQIEALARFARHTAPVIRDHLAMLRAIRGDAVALNDAPVETTIVPSETTVIDHPDGTTTTVIETH